MTSTTSLTRHGVAWVFVALQAGLLIAMVMGPRGNDWSAVQSVRVLGRGLEVSGVLVGLWSALALGRGLTPSPLPNGRTELVSRGPYRWVRHPMYTAVIVLMAGVAVLSGSSVVAAELVALVLLFNIKSRWEEERLVEVFPGYLEYRLRTNRFIPRPRSRR